MTAGGRPERWRLFVSLPLPAPVAERLGEHLAPLRRTYPAVRWLPAEQLHLTLAFLGDMPSTAVGALEAALGAAAARHAPIELMLGGAGTFGRGPARVAWVGLVRGGPAVAALAADVSAELDAHGVAPSVADTRPYRAHLTVARHADERLGAVLGPALARAQDLTWTADAVVLLRSHLGAPYARHEAVASRRLGRS